MRPRNRSLARAALPCAAGLLLCAVAAPPARVEAQQATGALHGAVTARPAAARANVVVSLENVPGTFRPPARPVQYDQRSMQFTPHVLPIVRGTTVQFMNTDSVRHNVFSPDGERYDLGAWPQGETRSHTFTRPGVYRQLCQLHPEMQGFIVVLPNPFFALTDASGAFRIANIPPGTYTLRAWSERLPAVTQQVTVTAGGDAEVRVELRR